MKILNAAIVCTVFLIKALYSSSLGALTRALTLMSFKITCGRDNNNRSYMLLIVGSASEATTRPDHATTKKNLEDMATFYNK